MQEPVELFARYWQNAVPITTLKCNNIHKTVMRSMVALNYEKGITPIKSESWCVYPEGEFLPLAELTEYKAKTFGRAIDDERWAGLKYAVSCFSDGGSVNEYEISRSTIPVDSNASTLQSAEVRAEVRARHAVVRPAFDGYVARWVG
jgi:hypothetical protein